MTLTIDADIPRITFPQQCKRADPSLAGFDILTASGSIDTNLIAQQRMNQLQYLAGTALDRRYYYGKSIDFPASTFVVFESEKASPDLFTDLEYGHNILLRFGNDDFQSSEHSNQELALSAAVYPELERDVPKTKEESFSGIQTMDYQHKVLFSTKVEFRTSELRRWKPYVFIDPILLDDDE